MIKRAPDLMSRKIEEEEDQNLVYRVEFDLTATRNARYSNIIQILFDQMCVHDPECCIKSYFENDPTNDIVKGINIGEQCWNAKRFKQYFNNVWDTSKKASANGGIYQVNGKMRIEKKLTHEVLKGRMMSWLTKQKFYVRKSYIQEARVAKIGFF